MALGAELGVWGGNLDRGKGLPSSWPPPARGAAKEQATRRLDPYVIERFRADGPGWQGRIIGMLRKVMDH
ncbi:hypothetical protein D3Y57_12730 [Sphingomonas paeninsulae]|uniref:BrnA antitoxin family protein n=1 Tax=Sphingomonas paeninsulae TaxID=2319844 RepID=A0A494TLI1_SPHPE|nr:BrnA antitoxin family protein [Sphingomonas paeninsulae]AYJ86671.1 hypothetical protein D3Y57_12730 [Sphingomonas paeninsulae]